MKTSQRYIFIDILKGISIILVAYGHILPGAIPKFTEYAGIFRMPLFFFVSGILFNNIRYKNNFKEFAYKRYRGLVIPYIYFSILVALGYLLIENDYLSFIKNTLINGWANALWFIPVLIGSQLLFYPLSKLSPKTMLLSVLTMGLISFLSSKYIGHIPYNLGLCFCGAYFFGLGNFFKKYLYFTDECKGWKKVSVFIAGFAISLIYLLSPEQPAWISNSIPSVVFYIAPFGAIMCLTIISHIIEQIGHPMLIGFFSTCGKQSYIILAFHQIICMIAQQFVPAKIAIAIMIVSLAFLVWFIPKYTPWMLGKSKA